LGARRYRNDSSRGRRGRCARKPGENFTIAV
jgi:hypothetical protein